MKQSRAFIPTMREIPADVEKKSHQLLLRAGFLRQHTSGIYSYLPFGLKVLKKIETIIREEMEAIDAVEMRSSILHKEALVETFTTDEKIDARLIQVEDRKHRQYVIGALHKELITSLIQEEVHSYKQLPLMLYQIVTSIQDELRPRFGLIQSREFLKQEAYSFHDSKEDLQEKYGQMKEAYSAIFNRLHLKQFAVSYDAKDLQYAHQFIAPADDGDEEIAYSHMGTYAAHIDEAAVSIEYEKTDEAPELLEKIHIVFEGEAKDIAKELKIPAEKCMQTFLYEVDGELVAVINRCDYQISEQKLKKALNASLVQLVENSAVEALLACDVHSIGPIQLPVGLKVIADYAVSSIVNGVSGANENGVYFINVNPERDFAVNEYLDLRQALEGDPAPDGIGELHFTEGFEVGRIASLGTSYSEGGQASYIDENGEKKPFVMGVYELNLSRIMAILAEQYHDESGLKWPKNLAPYDIHLVPIDLNDEHQFEFATNLYHLLQSYRFGVLFDDRVERAGVKFQDADLIGLPVRITIGQKAKEGILEVKFRDTGETVEWQIGEVTEKLQAYFTMHE